MFTTFLWNYSTIKLNYLMKNMAIICFTIYHDVSILLDIYNVVLTSEVSISFYKILSNLT